MNRDIRVKKENLLIYYGLGTRRGKDLSNELNGHYYKSQINLRSGGVLKSFDYLISTIIDIIKLWTLKPHTIIVELAKSSTMLFIVNGLKVLNPSIKTISDCHTAAYLSNDNMQVGFSKNKRKLVDKCDAIILHNEESLGLGLHNCQFVIESKIPDRKVNSKGKNKNITFITSCNPDEPIKLIFEVSKFIGEKYKVYFTGDYNKLNKKLLANKPDSIIGTGFLSVEDYNDLIGNALVLVVLTERDFTLLYGGREALAYNIPVVLTKNNSNAAYFYKGAVLVNNKIDEIVDGIEFAINNKKYLKDELSELNQEKMELWNDRINHINKYLNRT